MPTTAPALTMTALHSGLDPTAKAVTTNASAFDTTAISGGVNGKEGVSVLIGAEDEGVGRHLWQK